MAASRGVWLFLFRWPLFNIERRTSNFLKAVTDSVLTVRNPATLNTIAELPVTSASQTTLAVARARAAQASWERTGFQERGELLYRFRDLIIDSQEELLDRITAETGKPRAEALVHELLYICDAIGYWARYAARHLRTKRIRPHLFLLRTKKVYSAHHPLGVVGVIAPWNFPLVLTVGEAVPALMAGNAVIIKPSELTPLSVLFAAELAKKAGFPEELFQVVIGAAETGEALVDAVDMVSFTGSVEAGRKVMRRAADRLIPVSLELGGKDPMIVLKDADLDRAVNACVWGSLINSGQACASIERVYVEEAVYDPFINKLVEKVRSLRQGPSDHEVDIGSMVSEEQLRKVSAQIDDAIRNGAKALTGGRINPELGGLYYLPTVLIDVKPDMLIIKEETFGPVIPVMKVSDPGEALRQANASRYGLNASIFARDKRVAWRMAQQLQAGAVCVNDALVNYGIPDAPAGGIKDSGYGRRHGAVGIRRYCYQKTIVIDRLGQKSDLLWFPTTHRKTQALRRVMSLLWRSGWRNKFRRPRRSP